MLYKGSVLKNVSKLTDKHKRQSSSGVLSKEKMFLKILQTSKKNIFAGVSLIKLQSGNLKLLEAATRDVLFANLTGKNLCWSLSLIKLWFWGPATLLKTTPTQALCCEIYKRFQNNYFEEHLWMSTAKLYLKRDSNIGLFLWTLWIIQEHLFCRGSTNVWLRNTSEGVSLQ